MVTRGSKRHEDSHVIASTAWVKINSDIENTCISCESCQEQQDANMAAGRRNGITLTSRSAADKLSQYCSMFGRPDQFLTDNGPQYTGQAFKTFTETWGITHHELPTLRSQHRSCGNVCSITKGPLATILPSRSETGMEKP